MIPAHPQLHIPPDLPEGQIGLRTFRTSLCDLIFIFWTWSLLLPAPINRDGNSLLTCLLCGHQSFPFSKFCWKGTRAADFAACCFPYFTLKRQKIRPLLKGLKRVFHVYGFWKSIYLPLYLSLYSSIKCVPGVSVHLQVTCILGIFIVHKKRLSYFILFYLQKYLKLKCKKGNIYYYYY